MHAQGNKIDLKPELKDGQIKAGTFTAEVDIDILPLLQKLSALEESVERIISRLSALDERRKASYPPWLTVEETAELLRTDVTTVYRKIAAGKLPVSPHGKPWRISRDALFEMARKFGLEEKRSAL